MRMTAGVVALLFGCSVLALVQATAGAKESAYTDPEKADADFPFQGEYSGEVERDGQKVKVGVQVIALGGGKFDAVAYVGGLPGDGWDKSEKKKASGELADDVVTIRGDEGMATIKAGVLSVLNTGGDTMATLNKTERKSSTLGQKPPEGAVVLFDGGKADAWEGGRMTDDGLLMEGATSKQKFGSCTLHVEFRLPYQPDARGQGRGNSGVYLQGRHEVQMLDSFGLEGKDNECGGLYSVRDSDVNMCYPPLAWQTYDIDYTAAEYADGKKVKNATISVRHNGVAVHENVELPKASTGAPVAEGPEKGPIHLQNHGNPVRYRNIWLVEK